MSPPPFRLLLVSLATLGYLASLYHQPVEGVVVDGKRAGPSALKNQSHEDEMIDGYNTKTCGISHPDKNESDFVNTAREGQFPWLVSFQYKNPTTKQYQHFCMGSFISDKWVLSAAHCWTESQLKKIVDAGLVQAAAGSRSVYGKDNLNFTIKRIFYHSKFDKTSPIGFDIALIEIKEKAPIKPDFDGKLPYVNTVCLPIEGKVISQGQAVKIAGWGDSESKDPKSKPDKLLTTDMVITDPKKCVDVYSKKLHKVKKQYQNFQDFICADWKGQRDACQGDSGGSLLEFADGKAVAVGIVSYGLGCATYKNVSGVYEKVSSLMPWIKDITQFKEKAKVQFKMLEASGKKD